jgi:hypothetical protein
MPTAGGYAIAASELRKLEQSVPQFYQWLDETVLPMEL